MKFRLYRWSVWCGAVVAIAATVSYYVVGQLAPPSPGASTDSLVAFFQEHHDGILWAVVLMGIFAPLFYPFAVVTSLQMNRIEGGWGLLSMVQLTTAIVAPTGWIYPLALVATATYRQRPPEIIQMLSDQYWLTYVGVAVIFVLNVAVIGISALVDRRENPVFPRWFGWANLVLAAGFFPGVFVYVDFDGPFAWNGLFAMVIPSICFLIWKIMMIWALLRAVGSEEREARGDAPAVAVTAA
ncbi:hypothetical protein [Kineosporia mesophila]|uniref:hypothetical protein n=1 Tax=Kineosporia mesophila TaxID=566012 RepID=UPI001E640A35|nr:hypothetical protein [Kineosporia mesophila]MCD5354460.1 hypothetical protein [Kineosporia mesophila]